RVAHTVLALLLLEDDVAWPRSGVLDLAVELTDCVVFLPEVVAAGDQAVLVEDVDLLMRLRHAKDVERDPTQGLAGRLRVRRCERHYATGVSRAGPIHAIPKYLVKLGKRGEALVQRRFGGDECSLEAGATSKIDHSACCA